MALHRLKKHPWEDFEHKRPN
ncbi:uncharacterized protein G2W53_013459 [Senna tora]|uniref:Uncharacterized protein n=1 Tax=Senna tora TaxID=362788 RepID=A0A834WS77_9FABA|nr:uncharacterized protein G2W53_013459 [Senna tora]